MSFSNTIVANGGPGGRWMRRGFTLLAAIALLLVSAQAKEARSTFSVETPKGWSADSRLSKLANGVNLRRADKDWTFSISDQPANIPSEAAARKARTSPPDKKVKAISPITISGQKGYLIDWTAYGKSIYEAYIPKTGSGYFVLTLECPVADSAAALSDWNLLLRGVELKASNSTGSNTGAVKGASGGVVQKDRFTITLPEGWSEAGTTRSSRNRAIVDYSVPGASGRADISEDNMAPATLAMLRPRSSETRLVESGSTNISGYSGVYTVTVFQGERIYNYHFDNKRGGRYTIYFSCLEADSAKIAPSFKKLLGALKLK